ncbi:MAG: gliding motility-associated C-terminal domain-containing protein [Bacteroidota bacterium]
MNSTKLLIAFCFSSMFSLRAQQAINHDDHNHEHIDEFHLPLDFDKDSLEGFDEAAAWKEAQSSTENEILQKRVLAVLKRNYIDFKYGFSKTAPLPEVQGPCSNPGFETGTTAGWTTSQSPNNNSLTMLAWSNLTNTQANVVGTGFDPNVSALPTVPAGGGNFALRLGPTGYTTGGNSYRASQTFTVTAANSVFIYKYAVVLNNSSPHSCSQQPFFNIRFEDCNNNNIPCGAYNVTAIGSSCANGDPNFATAINASGNSWSYLTWQTRAFDLTSYIGQCVNVEFTVGGCVTSQGAHGGYAYIDANCSPMTLNLNGTDIPIGQTNSSICGASTSNTLCAPPGFTYNWTGPGITGQTGQCVNTNANGTFSVTLGIAGSTCAFNPVLYSTFNAAPNPTVTSSLTQPVCALPAGSATISAVGGTGAYTYSWTPAAPSSSVNTNLPTSSAYTVTATDAMGCFGTTSFSIDPYPPAPSYTLAVDPSYVLSCASPSTTITFAPTNTNTINQWDGPTGVITGTNVVATAPGVYTYTTINTVSTCSLTGSINITGSINPPVVTSTVTQASCASPVGSASVSVASGTAPFTYSWSPGTVFAPTGTVNANLPPGTDYTVSVTDDLGCSALTTFTINPFSGNPSYTLTNNPGLAITCASPNTTLTFVPTNTNTSTSWSGPAGVITGTTTVVTATAAGTYSYVALNTVSTCSASGTFVITADTIVPVATPGFSCNVNTFSLNATSTPGIELDWVAPSTPTVSIGNPATSTAIGIYTLTAYDPNNGCIQTYTVLTSVPPISIVTSPTTNVLTCTTNTIMATTSPASTSSLVVTWNNGVTTSTVNPYPITASGTYTTMVQVVGGCSSQSVITVSTNTAVNVSIIPSSTIISCATGSVNLTAVSSVGGPYVYGWTNSIPTYTGTQFPVSSIGNYTVVALNTANGCTATATQYITMESINASFVADLYQGNLPLPVSFTNTSIWVNPTGTNYSWNFGDGGSLASNDTTVSHLFNTEGTFPVILTATNGFCTDTAMRYIKVDLISLFEVPNVFTPNGDGSNDVFTFRALNMGEITVTVFDRWGLKMFEATDTGNVRWDGKNKSGKTVTDGTYFYILTATGLDGVEYSKQGTINVFQ